MGYSGNDLCIEIQWYKCVLQSKPLTVLLCWLDNLWSIKKGLWNPAMAGKALKVAFSFQCRPSEPLWTLQTLVPFQQKPTSWLRECVSGRTLWGNQLQLCVSLQAWACVAADMKPGSASSSMCECLMSCRRAHSSRPLCSNVRMSVSTSSVTATRSALSRLISFHGG